MAAYSMYINSLNVLAKHKVLLNSMQELLELFFVHEEKLIYFHFVHVGLKSFFGLPSFIGKKSLSCG